jgi:membrane protein
MVLGKLRRAAAGWAEDQASQMGAALAYYTLFSLAPLLILAIAVIGLIFGEAQTQEKVLAQVGGFVDVDSAEAVRAMLENFRGTRSLAGASAVGLASLVFGATGMFTSLRSSLWRIWRLRPVEEGVIWGFVRTYLLALVMVLVSCLFLLFLLLVSTVMPILVERWADLFPGVPWAGPALDFVVSAVVLTLLFAFTYRFLSDGRLCYAQLWGGAFVAAALFTAGKMVIGLYLAYAGLASAYGAAGSVVVFLAWVYYSAQIVFFGAEVIRAGLPASGGG